MPRDTTRRKCGTGEALRIGVVGAGISGLTFAAAMRRLSPATNVELYERDESATSRRQGYSLGLKGDAGLTVKTLLSMICWPKRQSPLRTLSSVTNVALDCLNYLRREG